MSQKLFFIFLILRSAVSYGQSTLITPGNSQPSINTNSPNSYGIIPPSINTTQRDQIPGPQRGTVIFNTSCSCLNYYNGFQWVKLIENTFSDEYAPSKPIIGNTLGNEYFYASGNDEVNSIALITPSFNTSDYYVTGRAWYLNPLSQANIDGYFLAKFSSTPWERKVANATGYDVAIDSYGNVYTAGAFTGTAVFGLGNTITSDGETDVFLAKYDSNGNLQWVRKAGGTGNDLGRALSVNGTNVHLTGYFSNNFTVQSPTGNLSLTSAGGKDIFIARFDTNGNLSWAQRSGGTNDDEPKDITGNTIVGYFTGTATFGPINYTSNGGKDLFVASFDNNGNFPEAFTAGGTGDDVANGINSDNFITGYFSNTLTMPTIQSGTISVNSAGGKDMFLAHLISEYNFVTNKSDKPVARILVRGGGINDDEGVKITRNPGSGSNLALIAVAGNFSGNADFGGPFLVTNTKSGFVATFSWDGLYQWGKSLSKTTTSSTSDIALTTSLKPYIVGIYGSFMANTRPYPATMKIWTTE